MRLIIRAIVRTLPVPSITARVVEGTLGYIARRGGSPERVRAAARLRSAPDGADGLVDVPTVGRLFECAAREIDDPCLGMNLGAALDFRVMGTIAYAVVNAPSVGVALGNLVRYQSSFTRGFSCFFEPGPSVAVGFVLGQPRSAGLRHLGELCVAIVVRTMKSLLGDRWRVEAVRFEHAPYDAPAIYRRIVGCEPAFDHRRTELVVPGEVAGEHIPYADRQLLPVVERRLKALPEADDPLLHALGTELVRTLCDGTPTVSAVASRLRLSPRTLQRRLADRNTSFRRVLGEVRRQVATEYLQTSDMSLLEVALLLGYGDLSAFDHAFRGWTGETPSRYRERLAAVPGEAF